MLLLFMILSNYRVYRVFFVGDFKYKIFIFNVCMFMPDVILLAFTFMMIKYMFYDIFVFKTYIT